MCLFCCTYINHTEVFFVEVTEKSVHCSDLRGVHYIEICLQQKIVGGPGEVFKQEVFTNRGSTVI